MTGTMKETRDTGHRRESRAKPHAISLKQQRNILLVIF